MARLAVALVTAGLLFASAVPAIADHDGLSVPTTDLLPPIVPDDPAPERAEDCGELGLECLQFVEDGLAAWEQFYGCDHRAVFSTVYRLLTRETRLWIENDPDWFDDPAGLGFEALKFYELYVEASTARLAGEPVPEAWDIAFDANADGDWTGGHDMLLSISAHVQRDMPYVLAEIGLALPDGTSRKPDHDRMNPILSAAYDVIVPEIGRRYDPFMTTVDDLGLVVDDLGGHQLVTYWRERVWRNAENLVGSEGTPFHDFVAQGIEFEAARWANGMTTGSEIPGHREVRDAHCAEVLAAEAKPGKGPPDSTPGRPDGPGRPDDPGRPGIATAGSGGSLPATGGGAAGLTLLLTGLAVSFRRREGRAGTA
ncbi:MAG: DUF5995 family protein [Nitriliruptorales bacterium]|nr:DUF5995 family protein [Nitriliruptorales bacterium]